MEQNAVVSSFSISSIDSSTTASGRLYLIRKIYLIRTRIISSRFGKKLVLLSAKRVLLNLSASISSRCCLMCLSDTASEDMLYLDLLHSANDDNSQESCFVKSRIVVLSGPFLAAITSFLTHEFTFIYLLAFDTLTKY